VTAFLDNLIAFGRLLRQHGLQADTSRVIDLAGALQLIDLATRDDVHAACRTLLIHRPEDIATFDRLFDLFWAGNHGQDRHRGEAGRAAESSLPGRSPEGSRPDAGASTTGEIELSSDPIALRTWSDRDTIASKDFAAMSESELAVTRKALAQLTWDLEPRRTRRWLVGRGRRIDVRRALARSLRSGGEIVALPTRRRRMRPRRIVLLCDVSGSMERYTRTLLLFAHGLSRHTERVEAFLFATRLTRITMALRSPRPDAAMAAVSHAVRDWSGGTRIGDALRAFHQRWRRRTLRGESVVILISDGWDRGDPQLLRDQIARLKRSCHRLIWLNPLIGSDDYAPLTRGLQAALPYVDDFLPVRTLRDVRDLALHLGAIHRHGRHRHLHLRGAASARVDPADGSRADRIVHPRM
jgi:uncharacterized protein with von Willebrand factor type A (vWA) domain